MIPMQGNSPEEAVNTLARVPLAQGFKREALHIYSDAAGAPIYWRIRLKHPDTGEKWIRPMKMDESGAFQLGEPVFEGGKPLYLLQELTKRPDEGVMLVEGEWCADALHRRGVLTTTSGSADSAGKTDFSPIAGRNVTIWPDNDAAGKRYAVEVTAKLQAIGCQVRWVDIESLGLPVKGDCYDWLQAHPDATAADVAALSTTPAQAENLTMAGNAVVMEPEWPVPKLLHAELSPVPPFDADVLLPASLRPWVMDEADRMPCAAEFIAAAVIVAVGSVIGARCAIKPKSHDDWLVVPNLWGGVVGPPSAKKSPAISAALKPLERLITKAAAVYEQETYSFEAQKTVYEAKGDAIEAGIKKSVRSGKGTADLDVQARELQAHRQAVPKEPVMRRYKSNDTTVEKLGEILRDNPNGVLIVRDELTGLVSSWDKEGREGERAFYLEGWNGNSRFETDRIGRGSIVIPNVCLSIFGGIQPDKLVGYLEQAINSLANDGMLQRFQVLVYPDDRPWTWQNRAPNKGAREQAVQVFEVLAEFDPLAWGASPADDFAKFPHFQYDDAAQSICIDWTTDLHRRIVAEENPIIAQHLAKFDKLFSALALIFHLIDCAATGKTGMVSVEAVWRASAWCEVLEAHARRCYGLLLDDGLRAAQTLSKKIIMTAKGDTDQLSLDGFTARDVRRHQWRYLKTEDDVRVALDWLEDHDWLRAELIPSGPHGGRPTRIYRVNPMVAKLSGSEGDHDQLA